MYNFSFGASKYQENRIRVNADTAYGMQENGMIYGFLGIRGSETLGINGMLDGFEYSHELPLIHLMGGKDYVEVDYHAYNSCINGHIAGGYIPLRFSVELEEHRYYTVTVTVVNTNCTEKTHISICSEKRRFIYFEKELKPSESVQAVFNVNLESVFSHGALRSNNILNVSVCGRNVGLESIVIKKHSESGRTLWVLGDSTVCDYTSLIPYYPLRNYGGIGAFFSKYINPVFAVSNQAEGGLCAWDKEHFENAVRHMQSGDYLYVQFGINDKQQYGNINQYIQNLEKYYVAAHERGVKLIVASCTQRHEVSKNWNSQTKLWQSTMRDYAQGASDFVDKKVSEGAEDIVFLDVNDVYIKRLNVLCANILKQRNKVGFNDVVVNENAADYFYRVDHDIEVDPEHINEAGADNAAYAAIKEMQRIVQEFPNSILKELIENCRDELPYLLEDKIVKAGWAPNSCFPRSIVSPDKYPIAIKHISIIDGKLNFVEIDRFYVDIRGYAQIYNGDDLLAEIYSNKCEDKKILFNLEEKGNFFPRGCIYRVCVITIDNKFMTTEYKSDYWG